MIHVVSWKWQSPTYKFKFEAEHVNVLERAVKRCYDGDFRFLCVTDDPHGVSGETFPLWDDFAHVTNNAGGEYPSCYRRLKLFDPETQRRLGIQPGDRVVSIDLDTVVVDDLNGLLDRHEPFVGWKVARKGLPYFNGSLWMFRAGAFAEVWEGFHPEKSPKIAKDAGYLGSDQAWMSYVVGPDQAGWTKEDGIYTRMEVKAKGRPPADCRVVMFHGFLKPWQAISSGDAPWAKEYCR